MHKLHLYRIKAESPEFACEKANELLNPEKENNTIKFDIYHRIIIPVYIPNFEGYFKDGLEIFKLCIQSLLMTVHEKTRITIYNNASHVVVENYINELYKKEELIDQVLTSPRGTDIKPGILIS